MESNSLPPITHANTVCPYCGETQDPPPQRRKKCNDCGQVIHTWTDREARKKYLLTEQQAKAQEHSRRDARWKELNEQVRVASQAGDLQALRIAYYQQAEILFVEGRNHLETRRLSARVELQHIQSIGIERVRVRTADDERVCSYCRSLEGKDISIEDALEQMPIPGPNCDDNKEENPYGGRCRCSYEAIFDHSDQDAPREASATPRKATGCGATLALVVIVLVTAISVALAW